MSETSPDKQTSNAIWDRDSVLGLAFILVSVAVLTVSFFSHTILANLGGALAVAILVGAIWAAGATVVELRQTNDRLTLMVANFIRLRQKELELMGHNDSLKQAMLEILDVTRADAKNNPQNQDQHNG